MNDNLKMVREKETELDPLYQRMDTDKEAYYLNKYVFTGVGKYKDTEIPNTVAVTMNEPAVFANATVSVLQSAEKKRQTTITGPSDTASKKIENFLDDCFYAIDIGLRPRRIPSLWSWLCFHVCHRGPVGTRLIWSKNGVPEALPLDTRFVSWEDSHEGLEWICNHTRRTPAQIKKLYGIEPSDKLIDVYDFWTPEVNEVYVKEVKVDTIIVDGNLQERDEKNPYGFIPFVLQSPGAGAMFLDDDSLEHTAESIFFLARGLYKSWNQLMSVQQTKALELVRPPLKHPVVPGNETESPQPYGFKVGENMEYREGEEPEVMLTPDVNNAFRGAETNIMTAIHKGSPSISDLTDTAGERNAQWVTEQTELRDRIIYPRLETLQHIYEDSALLLIKGYRKLHPTFKDQQDLGRNEAKRKYSIDDLGDPTSYTIEYHFMPDNERQKLANFSVGLSMKGELSRDTRFRDIYHLDDPEGELDKLAVEEAEQADPVIFFRNLAKRLISQAKKKTGDEKKELLVEASIMADNMVEAIKKRQLGSTEALQGTENMQLPQGNSQGLLALPSLMEGRNAAQ